MGIRRPEDGISGTQRVWVAASTDDFKWIKPRGTCVESLLFQLLFPEGLIQIGVSYSDLGAGENAHYSIKYCDKWIGIVQTEPQTFSGANLAVDGVSCAYNGFKVSYQDCNQSFHITCHKSKSLKLDVHLTPTVEPAAVQIGSGRTSMSDTKYMQTVVFPRYHVEGWFEVKGRRREVAKGTTAWGLREFFSFRPTELTTGGQVMIAHSANFTLMWAEHHLAEGISDGLPDKSLRKAFVFKSGKILEATTVPFRANDSEHIEEPHTRILYPKAPSFTSGTTHSTFETSKSRLVDRVDLLGGFPLIIRKVLSLIYGKPYIFEFHSSELEIVVEGIRETAVGFLASRHY